jgi:hypothetical protein
MIKKNSDKNTPDASQISFKSVIPGISSNQTLELEHNVE